MDFTPDNWLAQVLGKNVYKLSIAPDQRPDGDSIRAALEHLEKKGALFCYCKVPTSDLKTCASLSWAGFSLVDTNLLFHKKIGNIAKLKNPMAIRFATATDAEGVKKVAGKSFIYSRFHLDPTFSKEIANKIKSEWAGNFFKGARGDQMVVAEVDGKIVGFLQLLRQQKNLVIDLIAVSKEFQGRGHAKDMINFAETNVKDLEIYKVGTQLANTPSVGFYEELGFRLAESSYVFHFHSLL